MANDRGQLITLWNVFSKVWNEDGTQAYVVNTETNEPEVVDELYIFTDDIQSFSRIKDMLIVHQVSIGHGTLYCFANEALAQEAIETIVKTIEEKNNNQFEPFIPFDLSYRGNKRIDND